MTTILVEVPLPGESSVSVAARAFRDQAAASAGVAQQAADSVAAGAASTAADVLATAADRAQTALDRAATAADRVQTGTDAQTATAQAGIATAQAGVATTQAGLAAGSATAAAGSLAAAQAITGGAQGVGVQALMVPRAAELGGAAFASPEQLTRQPIRVVTAAYQITPDDDRCTILVESGTVTLTLPLAPELPPWWEVTIWNRSGAATTVQRAASAVIGASATSITIANNSGARLMRRDAARFERIG